jgi:hypothetical protein
LAVKSDSISSCCFTLRWSMRRTFDKAGVKLDGPGLKFYIRVS